MLVVLQGRALSLVNFGPVYFGTSSVEHVVLRNNGPQECDWVSLLQKTAAGTEVVSDDTSHKQTNTVQVCTSVMLEC